MNKKFLALVAAALLGGPLAANAVPVHYDVSYTAIQGPGGTGSFVFDNDVGAITDFFWDFGGITGGVGDTYGTAITFGDTLGRFAFEILSQTDVHSGANCVAGGCSVSGPFTGGAPFGATNFQIAAGVTGPTYRFSFGSDTAAGRIAIRTGGAVAVPEPGVLSLFCLALLGIGFAMRRRRA